MTSRQASRYRCALASSLSSSATRSASPQRSCCEGSGGHSARRTMSAFPGFRRASSAMAEYQRPGPALRSMVGRGAVENRQVAAASVALGSIAPSGGRWPGALSPTAQGSPLAPGLPAASACCGRRPRQRRSISPMVVLSSSRDIFIAAPRPARSHGSQFAAAGVPEVGDGSMIYMARLRRSRAGRRPASPAPARHDAFPATAL
jgi:hypothetical protein